MARPSLFTPTRAALIVRTIHETGCSLGAAARVAGIGESTLKDWRKRGADELNNAEAMSDASDNDAPETLGQFVLALDQALAAIESKLTKCLVDAAAKDWRAAAWWLERRRPQDYSVAKASDADAPESPRVIFMVDRAKAEAELERRIQARLAATRGM